MFILYSIILSGLKWIVNVPGAVLSLVLSVCCLVVSGHKVRFLENHSVCPLVRIGNPQPSQPQASVSPPPRGESPNSNDWRKSLALCLLCVRVYCMANPVLHPKNQDLLSSIHLLYLAVASLSTSNSFWRWFFSSKKALIFLHTTFPHFWISN